MSTNLYFAYGSNLCPEQLSDRVPGAELLGVASLADYQFGYFRRSGRWAPGGAADIRCQPGALVWGALWSVPGWSDLDYFEGVARRAYRRIAITVDYQDQLISAESYTAIDKFPERAPIAAYWQRVSSGAQAAGLPEDYCRWLREHYLQLRSAEQH